jgi:cell wall-associated NlpC family hydrolase
MVPCFRAFDPRPRAHLPMRFSVIHAAVLAAIVPSPLVSAATTRQYPKLLTPPRTSAPKPAAPNPAPASRTALSSRAPAPGAQRIPGRIGSVTWYNARIYDGPAKRRIYNILQPGDNVILIGYNNDWYGVKMVDGRMGWMPRKYVRQLPSVILVDVQTGRTTYTGTGSFAATPLLKTAYTYLGIPYRWGGTSSKGIDCSGFVQSVFREHGMSLPRVARDQARVGADVPWVPYSLVYLQPGDRLYFACSHSYIDHTGIYIGGGYFIHSSGGRGVNIGHLPTQPVYRNGLVCARR